MHALLILGWPPVIADVLFFAAIINIIIIIAFARALVPAIVIIGVAGNAIAALPAHYNSFHMARLARNRLHNARDFGSRLMYIHLWSS